MAFIEKVDLGSAIYGYQVDEITEGDDSLVFRAIDTAIQEVKGYLGGNLYDIPVIFGATGTARNSIILTHTVTIAKWYLVELCNVDIIYEQAKDRYDRATAWLVKLSKGTIQLDDLPTIPIGETEDELDSFGYGSRLKFNHDIE